MALKASELSTGISHSASLVEDLKRTQIVQYAGSSGDYNPLHTDEIYTTEVAGYPSVFAHGMLTMGMTGKMLTDYVGDGRLSKYGVRFTNQVWPGDSLPASATVEGIEEIGGSQYANFDVVTTNQDGAVVLKGYAQARLD
jgi:acyl dehydratase